jgi:rhomboid protease GluP
MKTVEKRRMCPNCRAFITVSDRVCPYCGAQIGPRAIDLRSSQLAASMMPRANLTSMVILTVNVFCFLLELIVSARFFHTSPVQGVAGQVVLLLGGKVPQLIYGYGQWWRLITAGFLHGGFVHLAMNSYALWILVTEVEQFYGTSRLIVAYVFSTFTGFLASLLFSPAFSLGASAAAFGLIGIMLAMSIRHRSDPLVQLVRSQYTQWVIFSLVLSLMPGVDLAAHIGGFIGGFLVGAAGGLPGLPNAPKETFWKVLAGVAIVVVLWAFLQDFMTYRMYMRQM